MAQLGGDGGLDTVSPFGALRHVGPRHSSLPQCYGRACMSRLVARTRRSVRL